MQNHFRYLKEAVEACRGGVVNSAARVQGQAEGGELVLSSALAEDPGVRKYLIDEGLRSEESRAWLKGLDGEQRLIRLRLGG